MKILQSSSNPKKINSLQKFNGDIILVEIIPVNVYKIGNYIPEGFRVIEQNLTSSNNIIYVDGVWQAFNPHKYIYSTDTKQEEFFNCCKHVLVVDKNSISITTNYKQFQNSDYKMLDDLPIILRYSPPRHSKIHDTLRKISYNSLSSLITIKADNTNVLYNSSIEHYNNCTYTPIFSDLTEFLGNTSFGFEFETSRGCVPIPAVIESGLCIVRDGSISGHEYCTIPLQGEKGVAKLFEAVRLLSEGCSVDNNCSTHLTLGNLPKSKRYIVSLYILIRHIQEELFQMFPSALSNPVETSIKSKNYADRLPPLVHNFKIDDINQQIDLWYSSIFNIFTGEKEESKMDKRIEEISSIQRTWNISTRYYHVNMIKYFSKGLIEFRGHPPTLNPSKIYLWLSLCVAICKYAEAESNTIINSIINRRIIKLYDVIEVLPSEIRDKLQRYIEHCHQTMAQEQENIARLSWNNGKSSMNNEKRSFFRQYIKEDLTNYTINEEEFILQSKEDGEIPVSFRELLWEYDEEE